MPAPALAAAAAAGWTIEEIAAGAAVAGTVGGGVGEASASGGTGWNFDGPNGNLMYPREIGDDIYVGHGAHFGGTLIRFFADGYLWNNECVVRYHGLFSNSNEPPMCYANHEYCSIPVNRFMEVGFDKGGEELSKGLLNCGLSSYQHIEGDAEYPYLILYAAGKFDPAGLGEEEFGFTLYLSTFGTVHLGPINVQTSKLKITEESDYVSVYLDQ